MKKLFFITCVLSIFLTSTIFARGGREGNSITLHTGAVGGLYMEPGIIWASQWESAVPGLRVSTVLGGSATNPLTVHAATNPNAHAGMADTVSIYASIHGLGDHAPPRGPVGGVQNLRALWRFNVISWGHVIARPEAVPAGVNTVGELLASGARLRIALKLRGSGDEAFARRLFEAYGFTYEDLERMGHRITFNHPADIAGIMIDGHADITIAAVRVPAAYVLEMDASISNLRWLSIEPEVAELLASRYGYIPGFHPSDAYTTLSAPFQTVGFDHVVFVQAGMEEELVYKLVRSVMSDPGRVKAVAALAPFDPYVAWQNTGFPLHPGAERAFRAMGFMR